MKIAMTGVSGHMGSEALRQTMELGGVEYIRVLLSCKKRNNKLAKKLKKRYGDRIGIVRGTIAQRENCERLVADMDMVIHMAAVIPPASDSSFSASCDCNLKGTVFLVDAVKAMVPQPKFVHVSTVALYGNRNEKHPFGRVGDPLIVSAYDTYAMHKLRAERYVLDADLHCFAVLRQTAMLNPNMLNDNISDGLMFHTALNAPLEWVSARDSGYLVRRLVERELEGGLSAFWNNIYNIGAGKKGRCTGVDTFDEGFALIGGSAEKFLRPHWFAARNFHGMWFSDANELEELFGFQRDGVHDYWQEIGRCHKIFALGKCVPAKLIDFFLFRRLLKHPNSPREWLKRGDTARVIASFGSVRAAEELSSSWEDYALMKKGDFGDYDALRDEKNAVLLDHGYDESKPLGALSVEELGHAANFRGGELLSEEYGGDPYAKLTWRCHEGHTFAASPFTVLRGGHWCPECCLPEPWRFGKLARSSPFFAQVWYDSNSEDEHYGYGFDGEGKAVLLTEDEA